MRKKVKIVLAVRITKHEFERLRIIAERETEPQEDVNISIVVRRAIREYLDRVEGHKHAE